MTDAESEAPEVPLAPGEVHGLRFWHLSETGHLRSVVQQVAPWTAGENLAACVNSARSEPRAPTPPSVPVHPSKVMGGFREGHLIGDDQLASLQHYYTPWAAKHVELAPARTADPRRFPEMEDGEAVELTPPQLTDRELAIEFGDVFYRQALMQYELDQRNYPAKVEAFEQELAEYHERLANHREEAAAHHPPMPGCNCGFYLVRDTRGYEHYGNEGPSLIGVVRGYGRTQAYQNGWRVGKAVILAVAPWNFKVGQLKRYERRIATSAFGAGWGALSIVEQGYVDCVEEDRMTALRNNYPEALVYSTPSAMRDSWDWKVSA